MSAQYNQATTAQINRAMCEFMGWEFRLDGEDWFKAYYNGRLMWADDSDGLSEIFLAGFKYQEDWSKLIPVVEKIEGMGYKFQICRRRVTIIEDVGDQKEVLTYKGESKLLAAYYAAHQFIEKHNKAIENEQ